MTAYLTVVSTLLLVAVIYQIRILRRMNGKLTKLASPERDIRRIAKDLRESARENYRQSEYYAQLIRLLDLKAPIPATRNWTASPDVLLTLMDVAKNSKPSRILDLGSGMSTLVLAVSASDATVMSIDNSAEYAAKTSQLLASHGISNVDIRVAPLTPHVSGVEWYDIGKLGDISAIDLLFIDGPPGSKNDHARHPALAECLSRLNPRAIVVIDDASRDGEKDLAHQFAKALPNHRLEFLPHEKGTAVLLPQ